ncbi:tannase/feruloyl esterase family alpha/beta hydrolase [Caulobacter sp. RL271]|uniref:Tannase/feruloyl esterase family alpha/beta hydrolase n=1 Tax=Caulobacter segnis TaxID=88688 RepID=A0ABY5A089_9CAUL|nr:tannase/feruloyl esterase family alpha/beta hydrolase [Caulobacter segnis]USQ98233.1 tannase/feruloyl esterase family alpha/beta hydrolase [Caulobacter segnis]
MRLLWGASALAIAAFAAVPAAAASCDNFAPPPLNRTTLKTTAAEPGDPVACRIVGRSEPREGSRIGFEVWTPRAAWNGRILMLGNGGYSSALPLGPMKHFAALGYVVVATDTGHDGDGPDFARERPQAIADWAEHAVHESVVRAKAITAAYYGRPAAHAYFQGCSTGGHQALTEVQRHPDDFDGVVAGAPGANRTRLNIGFLWQFVQNHTRDADPRLILPASKLPMIRDAALAACRGRNGDPDVGGLPSDPYLNAPLACGFDPVALRCPDQDRPDCLTQDHVAALKAMYAGARDPRTGAQLYVGWPRGSEASAGGFGGWNLYWADPAKPSEPARSDFWRDWAGFGSAWDWRTFDFDRDATRALARLSKTIDAVDPDLEVFRRRGGKLIQWHGAADPVVPFEDSIAYYQRAAADQAKRGHEAETFYRLFLAPGVEHCQGGLGPAPIDLQTRIEAWVEQDVPPARLEARRATGGVAGVGFGRPLCPFPQVAVHDGVGPPDRAESFQCRRPASRTDRPAA